MMYENCTVLFVDDEVNILQSIRRGLIDEEFKALFASSGAGAIAMMEQERVDVIVTDMRMPAMTGLDLLQIIKERWPNTIKIVLSGYTQLSQILATINQVDIFKFLTKPWQIEELMHMVHQALDLYMLKEEHTHHKEVLETQNRMFQNILKKSKSTIASVKRNNELLGLCGKSILAMGNWIPLQAAEDASALMQLQQALFQKFQYALTKEQVQVSTNDLTLTLSKQLPKLYGAVQLETMLQDDFLVQMNVQLLMAIWEAIFLLFREEESADGIHFYIKTSDEQGYRMSMQIPHAVSARSSESDAQALLHRKMDFLTEIAEKAMQQCQGSFQALLAEDTLVFGMQLQAVAVQEES